jgi:hypothetical protein
LIALIAKIVAIRRRDGGASRRDRAIDKIFDKFDGRSTLAVNEIRLSKQVASVWGNAGGTRFGAASW